jgi:FkbM family methyltransferase
MRFVSIQNVRKFLRKTPEQRRITARFVATVWLAKLPYAPHKVRLKVDANEHVDFWWSYFPDSIDPNGDNIFSYWGDDAGDLRLLWKILQPGMTFLDVGAYHGIFTVIAAKKLEDTGRVVAFEPSPREQNRLELHLRLNGISVARIARYAVAAQESKANLVIVKSGNKMRNGLRPPLTDDPVEPVVVETTTIDKYMAATGTESVDLVKIDTEGAEIEVLRGAERLIGIVRPLVICEVLDQSTRPWGYPACEIVRELHARDYDWFDILADGGLRPHCPSKEYPEVRNYLAVPREKRNKYSWLDTSLCVNPNA